MRNAFSNAFGASGGGADATKLPLAGGTLTGQLIQSTNGAASTPPVLLNGTIFTGGSSTTTKPQHLIEPTGTTSTGWSTAGTMAGVNAPSGFVGDIFRGCLNGVRKAWITYGGDVIGQSIQAESTFALNGAIGSGVMALYGTSVMGWKPSGTVTSTTSDADLDAKIKRGGVACIQMGTDAAGVTNQHFKACNRITSDGVGANLTISGGNGRGGAGGSLLLSYYTTAGAGVAGTLTTALTINTLGEIIPVLPTSSAGLTTGALWNNLGIVTVA